MPDNIVCNHFNNVMIQKCGFNIEELDFGAINSQKNKTFIMYNFSEENPLNFDFVEPGFLDKDKLLIQPNKGTLEPGKHKIIKCTLVPSNKKITEYEGDLMVRITWTKRDLASNNVLPNELGIDKITTLASTMNKKNQLSPYNNLLSSGIVLGALGGSVKLERENCYLIMSFYHIFISFK